MTETNPPYYDDQVSARILVVRYVVGHQEREARVLSHGHSLEAHVSRLEALAEGAERPGGADFIPWDLVTGGGISIRLDAIVAIEAP
ncbi:hypothetical protein ACWD0D_34715 [Streptomyces griseoincarnatus]